ncbi:MAG: bifunctional metallophosphatase/5'-nucleotidase [Spirochaetales bacterium]|nr:bifunctional metallophosphatase/5'-nucleotidase [Spirochaetales bacterium]
MNRKRCILIISLLLCFLGSLSLGAQQTKTALTIYYTASLNGNLDGCDCKGQPRSGLVKTGVFLNERDRNTSVLFEAGDILDVKPDDLLAAYILETYKELEYTLISLGDQEFSNGLEALAGYRDDYPLLCNNISFLSGNSAQPFSSGPRIIERNGVKLGVFALLHPEVFYFYPKTITEAIDLEPPREAAERLVGQLSSLGADLIIGMFHGSLSFAEELAAEVDGIDVLLVGHEQRLVDAVMIEKTLIVSPGENGNRVGVLDLEIRRGNILSYKNFFQTFDYKSAPDFPSVRKRIQDYYAQLVGRLREDPK